MSRIFFETACFVTFLLISYGYCIMHEHLSLTERRSVAGLTSLLYLTLTGYKAAVPQFAVSASHLKYFLAKSTKDLELRTNKLEQNPDSCINIFEPSLSFDDQSGATRLCHSVSGFTREECSIFTSFMQVLIIFIYAVLLYVIMAHIARNLSLLREQLRQIQNEGVHMMQNAVHTKYTMFRLGPSFDFFFPMSTSSMSISVI